MLGQEMALLYAGSVANYLGTLKQFLLIGSGL